MAANWIPSTTLGEVDIYRSKCWPLLNLLLDWGTYRRKSSVPLDFVLLNIHTH